MQFSARIFLAWLILTIPAAAAEQSVAEIKQRLEGVQDQIRAERARYAEVQGKAGALEAELAQIETRIGDVARQLHDTLERLNKEHARLADLEQRRREQLAALDLQRTGLARQLRAAYAMGRQERFKLLLNQEDPQAVGRMLVYHDYINRARDRLIDEANRALAALRRLEDDISDQSRRLGRVAARLEHEQTTLKEARARRSDVLVRWREEVTATGRNLHTLIRNEGDLERLLKSIKKALADIPERALASAAFDRLKGELPWPLSGPVLGVFGGERTEGADTVWHGILIGASMGAEVRAVAGGRVAFAEWMPGYGLLMIIDHGDGYMSLYGNNQTLYHSVGTWIEPGALIARVGDSGGQSDSGLYFEIRHQGDPLDPIVWCSARDALEGDS